MTTNPQLIVPTDFNEWCATLPPNARKRLSIHELRQIWEPLREGIRLVLPYLDSSGEFHRHSGVDFPNAEHCPYCQLDKLRAELEKAQWERDMLYGKRFSERCYNALKSRAERAEQERDEALARLEWQPIETAPKDMEIMLSRIAPNEDSRVTEGYWYAPEHGLYLGDCGGECRCPEYADPPAPYWFSADGGFTEEHPPTHWKYKPQPPEGGSDES